MATKQDEIIDAGIQEIVARIERESAKTIAQIEAEQRQQDLAKRLSKCVAQLAPLQRFPSKYKAEIAALNAEMSQIIRDEEIAHLANGGKPAKDWRLI